MIDPQCTDELQAFGVCVFALPSSDFACDPQGYIIMSTACSNEIDAILSCP